MVKKLALFDKRWLKSARAKNHSTPSWVRDVMETLDTTGGVYLSLLRQWFDRFPLTASDKQKLKTELESFNNPDHLGAVNELTWWEFMRRTKLQANTVPTASTRRPDFKVTTPVEFFVEVSTLNISDTENKKIAAGNTVALNHLETLRRLLVKVMQDKKHQISYAASQNCPCVLVLFDYTEWSAFGTEFYRFLGDSLLGRGLDFARLPAKLSALVYVERKVIKGRIAVSKHRSAIYYNPIARHALPVGTLGALRQFWCQVLEAEPKSQNNWVWL